MKKLTLLLTAVLCLGLAGIAMAAGNDNHSITVTVSAINEIDASGTLELTINSATAGSDPDPVTDDTTCDLTWPTNEASKKITVETDQANPTFTLEVYGKNNSGGGTAQGSEADPVDVTNAGADFITGISTEYGTCDLFYKASATAGQGTGSDAHTVTYTITDV